jgi:hypothetical protein
MQLRFDSEDRYFVATQLEAIDPDIYYNLVPGVVGRKLIPPIGQANPNLPSYKFIATILNGKTTVTRGRAKDQPTASVTRADQTFSIHTFEEAFGWTVDEIRAAREVQGASLEKDSFTAALTKIEQDIDGALALGIPNTNTTGIANNAYVASTASATTYGWFAQQSGGGGTQNNYATAAQIVSDIQTFISAQVQALKQAQVPGSDMPMFTNFALWLPNYHWAQLGMMPFSLGSGVVVTTVLKYIMDFPMLKAVEPWWRLDTAASGNLPMAILVACDDEGRMLPFLGGALLPMNFERLPEQYTGRNVTIPCAGKCGGVPLRYPVGVRYLTGI